MQCLRCRHDNRETARFCEACGASLIVAGRADAPRADVIEGERRQATILFSDLSGYTALGESLDPEELDELVNRIKTRAAQIVERHGGMVNQFRGDEVFALFGIPTAHDDDPVRAVRAARTLHTMVKTISSEFSERIGAPLRFHSSVSCGLVVFSERDVRDGAIGATGDAINIGARLVNLARPDEILVNDEVRLQVQDFFETSPLELQTLKGKAEPVAIYKIEKETPNQTRFEAAERRGLTRFAGRQQELSTLRSCLDKAIAGEGQLVTLAGDPGVGKSRLVFEFRHGLDRDKVTVLQGRCQSFGMGTPYLPYIDTLRRGLQLLDAESADQLESQLIASVTAIDPGLEQFISHYMHLLSIASDAYRLPESLQGAELRSALEHALIALFVAYSAKKPLVWIVEDWHWSDEASANALAELVGRLAGLPLMIIVLHRHELARAWFATDRRTTIDLTPLDEADNEALIRSVFAATRLPPGFSSLVFERTGGNPFFSEEVSRALLEQGHVVVENGLVDVTTALETMDLPESVQATIRSRIDRVDREAKEVLRIASVIGREFSARLLQQVCRPGGRLTRVLQQLVAHDLIQQLWPASEKRYMFKHVLTQVVAYETLLHQQRRALHETVGHALEQLFVGRLEEIYEALAHHYMHGGDEAKAVHFLDRAGDKAAGVFSLIEACRHYRDAIALLDAPPATPERQRSRIDITLKLAKASHYATSEDTLKTLEVARAYAVQLGDDHRLARVAYWMGGVYRMLGNHPRVFAELNECMKLAERLGDEELQAFSLHVMGRACYLTGEYSKGIHYMERGMAISERLGNLPEISYSCGFSADCYAWLGDFDQAFPLAERSMTLAQKSGDLSRQGGSNWYAAAVHCMHGDWSNALSAASRCAELAQRIGGAYLIGAGVSVQGWATFMLGEREQGLALLREGFQRIQDSGSLQGTGLYAAMVADHLALAGLADEAVAYANKALSFLDQFGEGNGEAPAYRVLGMAAALNADWITAQAHLERSAQVARERGERPHLAITQLRLAALLRQRGEIGFAQERIAEARNLFAQMGMQWWLEHSATTN